MTSRGLPDNQVLWRYMDTAKFLHLLHSQTLHFTRGDQFEDKYEGAFTSSLRDAIKRSYEENDIQFTYPEFKRRLRERVYLNCWHLGPDDNMAMWKIYGQSSSSVAITTTVKKLRDVLKSAKLRYYIGIAKVEYIKHWRDPDIRIAPYSNVFSYKAVPYRFEQEVRVILDCFDQTFEHENTDECVRAPVALRRMLRSIVVAPDAKDWFRDLLRDVTKAHGLSTPIRRSQLARTPI